MILYFHIMKYFLGLCINSFHFLTPPPHPCYSLEAVDTCSDQEAADRECGCVLYFHRSLFLKFWGNCWADSRMSVSCSRHRCNATLLPQTRRAHFAFPVPVIIESDLYVVSLLQTRSSLECAALCAYLVFTWFGLAQNTMHRHRSPSVSDRVAVQRFVWSNNVSPETEGWEAVP